jgi:phage repressor protein C with HTH and peptisase S24 domain
MEPYLAAGGIVMADISEESRDLDRVREGRIYVLCWDLQEGECAVKFLQWYKKGERVLITSANHEAYPPLIKRADEIQLVGRVIWAWREFD